MDVQKRTYHKPFVHLHRLVCCRWNRVLVYVRKRAHRQVFLKRRWYDVGFKTPRGRRYDPAKAMSWGSHADVWRRTRVRGISRLRGLLEAGTMRFPASFLIAGTASAWGRMCLDMGVERKSNCREKFRIHLFAVLYDVQTSTTGQSRQNSLLRFQILWVYDSESSRYMLTRCPLLGQRQTSSFCSWQGSTPRSSIEPRRLRRCLERQISKLSNVYRSHCSCTDLSLGVEGIRNVKFT